MNLFFKYLVLMLLVIATSCNSGPKDPNQLFSIEIAHAKKAYHTSDILEVSVHAKKNAPVNSVRYALDDTSFASGTISLADAKMGNRILTATIDSEGETFTLQQTVKVVASEAPVLYSYRILETYPHDIKAYTQGLEFVGDTLYESTGLKTQSSLRKTDFRTGAVLKKIELADTYFGEGLTVLNNKIYQLTWRENTGFIYDLNTMEKEGTFTYGESREGWGFCNDGKMLYKSDGTEKIWTLNPETLIEEGYIEIYTNSSVINNVNELEWVEGKIYANVYQKSAIAIVNPSNGAVEGVINLTGLQENVTQHTTLDVLNGIAYKGELNILYVTGKNWDKLFKIEIFPKQ